MSSWLAPPPSVASSEAAPLASSLSFFLFLLSPFAAVTLEGLLVSAPLPASAAPACPPVDALVSAASRSEPLAPFSASSFLPFPADCLGFGSAFAFSAFFPFSLSLAPRLPTVASASPSSICFGLPSSLSLLLLSFSSCSPFFLASADFPFPEAFGVGDSFCPLLAFVALSICSPATAISASSASNSSSSSSSSSFFPFFPPFPFASSTLAFFLLGGALAGAAFRLLPAFTLSS
mmetsp:Transcript_30020/g.72359  ORF Transcript_30020/g.72359 Transcript_30020/m.72359 type:complete len:234 (-) Transcript_30020:380-1081(-)